MEMQGWPLWAVQPRTGQAYAVVGWEQEGSAGWHPVGVEITATGGLDQPVAIRLGNGLRYTTDPSEFLG